MVLSGLELPQLENGAEEVIFQVDPNLLCDLATRVRVLPRGLALQQQARMSARVWVEKQLRHARRHEAAHATSGSDVDDSDDDGDGDGGNGEERRQQTFRRKKFVKLTDEDLRVDWYEVLQLSQGERATEEQIRTAYRRCCLETHPDKQKNHSDEAFKRVQRAFDLLGDTETRLAYDSSRPFDDSIPGETLPAEADFYALFGPVFERNKKWSSESDLPSLGDDSTGLKAVYRFYDRWGRFQSWRDFSHLVELDEIDDSMCREEKRYYARENERQLNHLRREEQQRLRTLVERARKNDPRLRRKRDEDEARRQREKEERELKRRQLREEEERRRAEEAERERFQREEAQRKEIEKKNAIRQAQRDLLEFLEQHSILDETATNKLLRHTVRRPNVVWMFSKITSPEQAASILAAVTSCSTERRPATVGCRIKGNNRPDYDGDEGVSVEAVLRFNALVEEREQQIGVTRYGEPIKKCPAASTTAPEVTKKAAIPTALTTNWDEEDLVRLQKATAKYPPGAVDRWRKIAEMLRGKFTEEEAMRKVNEITAALHHANTTQNRTPSTSLQPSASKLDVAKGAFAGAAAVATQVSSIEDWTVKQQKMLEQGLRELKDYKERDKFQKIAAMVDGKNAKECFERYKYLCSMNKHK
ncbi:chaperone protein DNAJ [Trypanosoma rangeli]|uniref:Chaperone protein DNAJ n=1 Tax=Trypanosoma rangeli TaxID=5698 RepID=A0A422NLR6_TRYRA|nr:chaperone protein DNAJ [Trypanosoma rangeli]RNF06344.1 chaperone protein DNAJ [Trypanosoma rangeli]|eukprot:RNF06344.1 chaperone protein DNAJ [Trypanosoma rangeli]